MMQDTLCMGCMKDIGDADVCPHCGFSKDTPQIAPYLPLHTLVAERYLIGKVLSAGGDGVTYMGWDCTRKIADSGIFTGTVGFPHAGYNGYTGETRRGAVVP